MLITPLVAQLRQYCPDFAGRVAAGIDFEAVANSAKLNNPSAYVIYTGDSAGNNDLQNGARQAISDEFDVILVMNTKDERGQEAVYLAHGFRAQIWRALIGWCPDLDYTPIEYEDSALLQLGLNLQLTPQASLNLGYSGQVGDGNNDHGVRLGLNFAF